MKATVLRADLIELRPENDADLAVLKSFESRDTRVRISSIGQTIDEPPSYAVSLNFYPRG